MGRAFATRALERAHLVTVWNRSAGIATDLVAKGAVETESPQAAVIGSDVVLVVLADDAAVLEVCLADDGLGVDSDQPRSWPTSARYSPDTVRRLAEAGPG